MALSGAVVQGSRSARHSAHRKTRRASRLGAIAEQRQPGRSDDGSRSVNRPNMESVETPPTGRPDIRVLQGRLEQPGGGYHQPQRGSRSGHPRTGRPAAGRGWKAAVFRPARCPKSAGTSARRGEGDTNAISSAHRAVKGRRAGTPAARRMAGACGTAFSPSGAVQPAAAD